MDQRNRYEAPWGRVLILTTVLCGLLCIGCALLGAFVVPAMPHSAVTSVISTTMIIGPMLMLVGGAAFMVRGYTLTDSTLIIHRLGWSLRLDLSSLASARTDPSAMTNSVRMPGNGGFFAFCGWFRSTKLGNYRVFATDPQRSVVLRFKDRTVVVTPHAPDEFVQAITNANRNRVLPIG